MYESQTIRVAVQVSDGNHDVVAYKSSTPGLAIHKKLVYSYANQTYGLVDNEWTITHIPSGLNVLGTMSLPSLQRAASVAKDLSDFDWVAFVPTEDKASYPSIDWIRNVVAHGRKPGAKTIGSRRYVMRPAGAQYEIVDTETNEVVETQRHRGTAAERAQELNSAIHL